MHGDHEEISGLRMLSGGLENTHRGKKPQVAYQPHDRAKERTFCHRGNGNSLFDKRINCCGHGSIAEMVEQTQRCASVRIKFLMARRPSPPDAR
jgi:hypothetical protein